MIYTGMGKKKTPARKISIKIDSVVEILRNFTHRPEILLWIDLTHFYGPKIRSCNAMQCFQNVPFLTSVGIRDISNFIHFIVFAYFTVKTA